MAQQTYRGNLSAKVFPFIAEYFGPTVIIPGADQNFQRQLVSSEDLDKDRGIPQVYYCHNVMPSAEGFQSIGYVTRVTSLYSGFKNVFTLKDVKGNEYFFAHAPDGNNYVLALGSVAWVKLNAIAGVYDVDVSVATINGQSYIYFANNGCYMYDSVAGMLVPIALTGLDTTQVLGITSSAGYMIAWTSTAIAWSSTVEHSNPTDPIDFVPSLETGAGGGNVEAAKGPITFCMPHYLGFIIYTDANAVAAVYSGNARFPFNLREIVNSGGVTDISLVSYDSNSGNNYVWSTSGLQIITISQTQTVFPEITDFLGGSYFEDFDEDNLQFVRTQLTSQMLKAINMIADRYLVISYGISSFTHALVYDTVQKRFGKLRVPHVSCFEWKQTGANAESPKQTIALLQSNGNVITVDFGYGSANSSGCMLLGKYQLSRARTLTLDEVELENIITGNNFSLYNFASVNGKTFQPPVAGYLALDSGDSRVYTFRQTGINHTLLALGNFYMSSIVLKFHLNGRR